MTTIAEFFIQTCANDKYPADWIWIKEDFYFYAIKKRNNGLTITSGWCIDEKDSLNVIDIEYRIEEIKCGNEYLEQAIDEIIEHLEQDGYSCFAMIGMDDESDHSSQQLDGVSET
jgi:hypothetical protein